MESFIPFKPVLNFFMFVSGVVVADDMNLSIGWNATLDEVEKFDPFLMTMFAHTGSDDGTFLDVERSKK